MISIIELIYLLTRQFFKRQSRERQERSRTNLPPASEMFLSIPAERRVVQKPRNHKKSNDKRVFVTCQPALHRRAETTNFGDVYRDPVKF